MRLLDQFAELGRAVGTAKQAARAVELERDRAVADAERLKAERIDALAGGDDELAERLQAHRVEAERVVGDLEDRLTAAQLAATRAEAARQRFASDNIDGLLGEHARDAQAAADGVTAALDQLAAAVEQWRAAEAATNHLLRLGGRPRERPAQFPSEIGDLVRRLSRASATIPAPMPASGARDPLIAWASSRATHGSPPKDSVVRKGPTPTEKSLCPRRPSGSVPQPSRVTERGSLLAVTRSAQELQVRGTVPAAHRDRYYVVELKVEVSRADRASASISVPDFATHVHRDGCASPARRRRC